MINQLPLLDALRLLQTQNKENNFNMIYGQQAPKEAFTFDSANMNDSLFLNGLNPSYSQPNATSNQLLNLLTAPPTQYPMYPPTSSLGASQFFPSKDPMGFSNFGMDETMLQLYASNYLSPINYNASMLSNLYYKNLLSKGIANNLYHNMLASALENSATKAAKDTQKSASTLKGEGVANMMLPNLQNNINNAAFGAFPNPLSKPTLNLSSLFQLSKTQTFEKNTGELISQQESIEKYPGIKIEADDLICNLFNAMNPNSQKNTSMTDEKKHNKLSYDPLNLQESELRSQNQVTTDCESKSSSLDHLHDSDGSIIIRSSYLQERKTPGIYSKEERAKKIQGYKNKIMKWRNKHPVSRAFSGRSQTAVNKPRIKGKFVSAKIFNQIMNEKK